MREINGQKSKTIGDEVMPFLEINLDNKVIMGNSYCDRFIGRIKKVNAKKLVFGDIKPENINFCTKDDSQPDFIANLRNIVSYELNDLILSMKNKDGEVLLRFHKVD